LNRTLRAVAAGAVVVAMGVPISAALAGASPQNDPVARTASPIKHVVVIFQENVSFDHYFGTYPNATNADGTPFTAAPGTPKVNGLTAALRTSNPNLANPTRLDPANVNDLLTCDQDHGYTAEQTAFDDGAMDQFVQATGTGTGASPTGQACNADTVMDYYDGNTVTAMWNYAQNYAMSDNSFGTTFGPSAPGAINLISGDTNGAASLIKGAPSDVVADGDGGYTLINDAQPYYDDCSSRDAVAMTGENVGDQLNRRRLSWGWFEGGFAPSTSYSGPPTSVATYDPTTVTGRAVCGASHPIGVALGGTGQWGTKADYIPHHEPFQYYASTANPHHLAPASLSTVGTDTATPGHFDTANHQYDLSWFDALVAAIHHGTMSPDALPAVSFLKAPGYEDGHAAYSDPIDEQAFLVKEINSLEQLPDWSSTAVIIAYDDSDGWYDHAYSGVTNASSSSADTLTAPGSCTASGATTIFGEEGRCGYGPRLPLLVISPWARVNFVDHTLTDQSSILKFIEWNWRLGSIAGSAANIAGGLNSMFDFDHQGQGAQVAHARLAGKLFLNPRTGSVVRR
jgi:phospholipase C